MSIEGAPGAVNGAALGRNMVIGAAVDGRAGGAGPASKSRARILRRFAIVS